MRAPLPRYRFAASFSLRYSLRLQGCLLRRSPSADRSRALRRRLQSTRCWLRSTDRAEPRCFANRLALRKNSGLSATVRRLHCQWRRSHLKPVLCRRGETMCRAHRTLAAGYSPLRRSSESSLVLPLRSGIVHLKAVKINVAVFAAACCRSGQAACTKAFLA